MKIKAPIQDANDREVVKLKEEIISWIFSISCSLLIYAIVAVLIQSLYHPDIAALKAKADELLIVKNSALPEPMEAFLFRAAIITIIPCLYFFYSLFSKAKWIKLLLQRTYFTALSVLCPLIIAALIFFGLAAHNVSDSPERLQPVGEGSLNTNFNFYFDGFFTEDYWWLYLLIIVPSVALLFFAGIKKNKWEDKKIFRVICQVLGYGVILYVLITIALMNTFQFPYSDANKQDLNAVYYSMTQVYAGLPMLVNGLTNTYGLYPHFLNPLFHITGMSVFKFSLVMSVLTVLCFVLNFYTLSKFVKNRVILFLGFATMIFVSYMDRKLQNQFDCLFSLFPIRYIVPSVLFYLATLYAEHPSVRKYWLIFFVQASFVLWNPEMGLVSYLAWIAFNMYRDMYDRQQKLNIRRLLFHLLAGIGTAVVVLYSYKGLIYLCYGSSPDMGLLLKTMLVFSSIGFGLLPMTLLHPWNILALVLILGFTYSIAKLHKKEITTKSQIIFLLSLIGVGYFAYFQGRSHNSNFLSSAAFCIMLLTILGDELWYVIKARSILLLNGLFVCFLLLISFSFIELVYNADKLYSLIYQEEDRTKYQKEEEFIKSKIDFISAYSVPYEPIHILTSIRYQGLYFCDSKRRSAYNPGIVEFFLQSDLERFINVIRDSSFNVFIDGPMFYYPHLQSIAAEVAAEYEYKASDKSMFLLSKRKTKIPARSFFGAGGQRVFHRKYNDDTVSARLRLADAFNADSVTLNPESSVQVLFYTKMQIYPAPSVVAVGGDSLGFLICNILNTSSYMFLVNSQGVSLPLENEQWAYCVINSFPDHMDVYVNGVFRASHPLTAIHLRKGLKTTVGNAKRLHYYIGAIAEVTVTNNSLSKDEIQSTWKEIDNRIVKE